MESTTPYVIPESAQKPKVLTLVPSDPGSRYKTKQIQVQTVGKSKMIKSFFLNINEVAKSMKVPPSYIVHFIAYSIGTQAKYDVKKPERQQAFLTGEHDTKDLSKWTVQFIQEVLLCPTCGLPELHILIEKNVPTGSCRACGSCKPLPITNERFKKHVINHPPAEGKGTWSGNAGGTKKAGQKERKSSTKKKNKDGEEEPIEDEDDDDDDDDDNVVWFSDTSAEATKRRKEQLMADTDMSVEPSDEVEKAAEEVEKVSVSKKEKKSKKKTEEKEEKTEEKEESLFNTQLNQMALENGDISGIVKKQKQQLSTLLEGEGTHAQFLEWMLAHVTKTKNSNKVAHYVKDMYDEDLLEEEEISAWFNSLAEGPIKTNLAPLIKWFEEAEEESEEEEDE